MLDDLVAQGVQVLNQLGVLAHGDLRGGGHVKQLVQDGLIASAGWVARLVIHDSRAVDAQRNAYGLVFGD